MVVESGVKVYDITPLPSGVALIAELVTAVQSPCVRPSRWYTEYCSWSAVKNCRPLPSSVGSFHFTVTLVVPSLFFLYDASRMLTAAGGAVTFFNM